MKQNPRHYRGCVRKSAALGALWRLLLTRYLVAALIYCNIARIGDLIGIQPSGQGEYKRRENCNRGVP